jgi:uncharacterized protein YggE
MKKYAQYSAATLILFMWYGTAFGQFDVGSSGGNTVSANGQVSIEKKPDVMRLKIQLLAKGSSLEDAIKLLAERKESAIAQLTVLGAEKSSIHVAGTKITSTKNPQQAQMEAMLSQRLQGRGRGKPVKKVDPVVLGADLVADWKIAAETTEELLLLAHPLQNKIKEADVSGRNEASKLSAAEQELLEEMEESGYGGGYGGEGPAPGEPTFLFVATISKQERLGAMAKAFKKAKAEAEEVAAAAGATLGKISSLATQSGADSDSDAYAYARMYPGMYSGAGAGQGAAKADGSTESVAAQAGTIKYSVTVMAAFELKE